MAKAADWGALLLFGLILIASCGRLVAGKEEMVIIDNYDEAGAGMDRVHKSTLWMFGYKPFFPWWPVETCGWDFATTAYWQVIFSGITVCDVTYGKNLAAYASTTLRGRSFASIWFGSPPTTSTVLCSQDRPRKRVTYVIRVSGSVTALRRLRGTTLPRSTFSAGTTRLIRGTPKGAKFFSSEWISGYWCNGCPLTPDLTPTFKNGTSKFAIDGITYSCTAPVANGEVCFFTCPDGSKPVNGTAPVCKAAGWSFTWQEGGGGLPGCADTAPAQECNPNNLGVIVFGSGSATSSCPTDPPTVGTTCTYTCSAGLIAADSTTDTGTGPTCIANPGGTTGNWTYDQSGIPQCGAPCAAHNDCTDVTFPKCSRGICVQCTADSDCGSGGTCQEGNICFNF